MLTELLNLFGFVSVVLRAATLASGALVMGGIVFRLLCARRLEPPTLCAMNRLLQGAALGFAAVECAFVTLDSLLLISSTGLPFREVSGAAFFAWGVAAASAALIVAFAVARRGAGERWLLFPAAAVLGAELATSHAAARLEGQAIALVLTGLHQAATALWIGGLPYLLIAVSRERSPELARPSSQRFSRLAFACVVTLASTGCGLGLLYIGSARALYGTTYGVMAISKAVLFAVVIAMGALNYGLVRATWSGSGPYPRRLGRLTEAEIGMGITLVLLAASLTSQPPAIDLPAQRASLHDVVERFHPAPPRLRSPSHDALSSATGLGATRYIPGQAAHPNTAGDIAWSEYNHNWAGLVVLTMGIAAVGFRVFGLKWARHWPLAFLGLAYFLMLRADPEAWPLGPKNFWVSMLDPEVLQHRIFALLIVAFAIFEWSFETGRLQVKRAALVFPGVCAAGGALLLTHSHALGNWREEYLAELSHLPIAVAAVVAGWSRWLERRLDAGWRRIPGMVWPVCFVAIGLLLLFYRES